MPSSWEYSTGRFSKCPNPNCGNTNGGDTIYKCKETMIGAISDDIAGILGSEERKYCGKVFCEKCGGSSFMTLSNCECPTCGESGSYIGKIKSDSSNDADDESDDSSDYNEYPSYTSSSSSSSDDSPTNYTSSTTASSSKNSGSNDSSVLWVIFAVFLCLIFAFSQNTNKPLEQANLTTHNAPSSESVQAKQRWDVEQKSQAIEVSRLAEEQRRAYEANRLAAEQERLRIDEANRRATFVVLEVVQKPAPQAKPSVVPDMPVPNF